MAGIPLAESPQRGAVPAVGARIGGQLRAPRVPNVPVCVPCCCHRQSPDCPRVSSHPPRPGSFGLEAVLPIPSAAAWPSLARCAVPPAQPTGRPKGSEILSGVCIGVCREFSLLERNSLETLVHPTVTMHFPRAQAHFYPPGRAGRGHVNTCLS